LNTAILLLPARWRSRGEVSESPAQKIRFIVPEDGVENGLTLLRIWKTHAKRRRHSPKHKSRLKIKIYQYCGSGLFITYHDFYPSRIPDPTTAKREKKKNVLQFFAAINITKLKVILVFELVKKKFEPIYKEL
jgi:hypothetical protein